MPIFGQSNNAIDVSETHIVPEKIPVPIRIQEYGVGIFRAAFTKSALKKVLRKNHVTVNGIPATSATFIRGGEHIRLSIPPKTRPGKKLVLPLKVLFEDDYLAVVHKPAGHPGQRQ